MKQLTSTQKELVLSLEDTAFKLHLAKGRGNQFGFDCEESLDLEQAIQKALDALHGECFFWKVYINEYLISDEVMTLAIAHLSAEEYQMEYENGDDVEVRFERYNHETGDTVEIFEKHFGRQDVFPMCDRLSKSELGIV